MKKVFALLLAFALVFSLAACAKDDPAPTPDPTPSTSDPTPTPDPTPEVPEVTGLKRLIVMNNAFEGLETSSQCYNAKEYHKAYSLGEIIEDNFWFTPAEDTTVLTVAYTDFYTDECALSSFTQKYISFQEDNAEFDYDLFVGKAQKESSDVKYKGYCVVDKEVILLMQEDGWNVAELFEYVGMADADAYDFICADGYVETISKDKLAECSIFYNDKGGVDATSVEYPQYGLTAIRYIVPTGMDENSEPAAEGVSKITVALNAEGVYDTEAPYSENRAGVYYDAWSVADLLDKFAIADSDKVKVISYKDGYTQEEDFSLFAQKYIAYQGPNEKGNNKDYFTLGRVQAKDAGVNNAGYYIFDEDALAFVPADGLTVAAAFEAVGMADAENYTVNYADGTSAAKTAAEVKAMDLTTDILSIVVA